MTHFHDNIKTLMTNMGKFCSSLSSVNLTPAAQAERDKILTDIKKLKKEYPQLASPEDARPDSALYDDTGDQGSSLDSDSIKGLEYEDTEIKPPSKRSPPSTGTTEVKTVAVTDLNNPLKQGSLKWKKEKKKAFGGPKKMYCVVSADNIFYIFAAQKSKKQEAAFPLAGYEASAQDANKKEFPFQLTCPGKPTYQFIATSKGEMDSWTILVNKAAKPGAASSQLPEVLYSEPEENRPSEISKQVSASATNDDDMALYDEAIVTEPTKPSAEPRKTTPEVPRKAASPPPMESRRPPPPDPAASPRTPIEEPEEDYYDDTDVVTPTAKQPAKVEEENEEYYDEGLSAQPPQVVKASPKTTTPPAPTPQPQPSNPPNDGSNYDDMYYGLYDCDADREDELPFKRGDIIEILNRNYDSYSWWVGKLNGRVGIVPKEYLSKAYEVLSMVDEVLSAAY